MPLFFTRLVRGGEVLECITETSSEVNDRLELLLDRIGWVVIDVLVACEALMASASDWHDSRCTRGAAPLVLCTM